MPPTHSAEVQATPLDRHHVAGVASEFFYRYLAQAAVLADLERQPVGLPLRDHPERREMSGQPSDLRRGVGHSLGLGRLRGEPGGRVAQLALRRHHHLRLVPCPPCASAEIWS